MTSIAVDAKWDAKWCWTRKHLARPWNRYAYFRRTVDLPAAPRRAVVRVSASARYTLYVNGARVHFGPARSFPHWQSFDTLDLAALLMPGRNVIAAVVLEFGIPTFQSLYRDASGFLLDGYIDLDGGKPLALHTPGAWLARNATAWRQHVARHSIQLGFQEHFDAGADPIGWMLPAYEPKPDDGWREPYVVMPVGLEPWVHMEERGVPLLAEHVERFTSVVAQFTGENARGHELAEDVYHLPRVEQRRRGELVPDAAAMLVPGERVVTIPPPQDGHFLAIVMDLDTYRTGHVMLDVADAAGGEIIDLVYSEALDDEQFPLHCPAGSHCQEATADRYRCRAGAQRWETFQFNGMRYAAVIFRHLTTPLKLRFVGIRQVHAAVENLGSFECSDERLNRIWQTARTTQLNCLFDAFVDCPWREQAMWWGDARVQSRVTAHAFGDVSILERGIRLMARSQAADGSLHAHAPADVPGHRLPDFMLTWVASLWDHYFHTGSLALVRECLPVLHRLIELFHRHENADGMIGRFDGWWVFLDWQELYKRDFSAVLNLLHLQALRYAAVLCQLAGDANAAPYRSRAARLEIAIDRYFWDAQAKVWRDGFDPATARPVEETSQHAHALALLLNLKPEHRVRLAKEYLLKPAQAKRSNVLTGSPFFYAYVLEALFGAGFRGEGIDVIRDKWGGMIDAGAVTFWELWDVTYQSRCHAWSASPLYHLSEQVLGVMPVAPGWRQIRIAPFCEKLKFARGIVPSPLGLIRVEWERAGGDQLVVRTDIPDGMDAEFVSPLGETRTLKPGNQQFRT